MEKKIELQRDLDPRIEKARMLVALLGADFTKDANHPFFRKATEIATGANAKAPPSKEMSAALLRLIDTLQHQAVTNAQTIEMTQPEDIAPPEHENTDLVGQHPAVIAQKLVGLDKAAQRNVLARLPRNMARQVTVYSLALGDKGMT